MGEAVEPEAAVAEEDNPDTTHLPINRRRRRRRRIILRLSTLES
jgi:hypothetical protein